MIAYYTHNLSPFLWEWGNGWGVRYYGVAYLLGFFAFYGGMLLFYRWKWSSLTPLQVGDLMGWLMVGVLVGGRLGYCLIYNLSQTLHDPISIIAFWHGGISGMSSHGGMLGAITAFILYGRRVKTDIWKLLDHAAILTTPGIFFGRIANFINGELWGRTTTVGWAVLFPNAPLVDGAMVARHPSQIYEALGEGLLLGVVLLYLRWRGVSHGKIGILFFVLYGLIRIYLETFREPDAKLGFLFGTLTMGQLLSLGLIFTGIGVGIWTGRIKASYKEVGKKGSRSFDKPSDSL